MIQSPLHTDAMNRLCSKDHLELLDSIDRLRRQGINNYISLPQIIVCGDQSSGKSSVLEAISGVTFPVKGGACTRFPTELVLRRSSQVSASVSILRHDSESNSEQTRLSHFNEKLDGFERLPAVIESAKDAMGISVHGKAFSKDILRVEISGPDRPHLTIVDLPGLIHSETKHQSMSDIELIQDVVQTYMKEPRSIILAVVSAKNDFANQIVLKLARSADAAGTRTLGVITKPDTLISGSDSESLFISLATNQQVEFRLGWHVLKNMDTETGKWSLAQRDAKEAAFFLQGVWNELPQSLLGIDQLRHRLSKVLLGQIASELPSLVDEIERKYKTCSEQLAKLGEPRTNIEEQRHYLLQISQTFQSLVKTAVDGTYNGPFFEDPISERGYHQRLRAMVQNINQEFAEDITAGGHLREISDSVAGEGNNHEPVLLSRDEFVTHIQHLIGRTRGRELPGTFDPMIVASLFLEQSRPWEKIAQEHIHKTWKVVKRFLGLAVVHVADPGTSQSLMREVFEPELDKILETMRLKTVELLQPHQNGHPITYNHYFVETLQRVRSERTRSQVSEAAKKFFNISSGEEEHTQFKYTFSLTDLVTAITESTEPDMNRFAACEALDCMMAYYKVALKRFIDDIAVEVVEVKLVSALNNILSPIAVYEMASDQVASIAGESEDSRIQREQFSRQLKVLRLGLDTCKRFVGIRLHDTALDIKDETVGLAEHSQDVHFSDDFSDAEVIPPSEAISLSSEAENEPMPEEEPVENISEAPVEEEIKPHHREKELDISSHKKKKKKGSKTPFWDE